MYAVFSKVSKELKSAMSGELGFLSLRGNKRKPVVFPRKF